MILDSEDAKVASMCEQPEEEKDLFDLSIMILVCRKFWPYWLKGCITARMIQLKNLSNHPTHANIDLFMSLEMLTQQLEIVSRCSSNYLWLNLHYLG